VENMKNEYNIYCDESCHLENDNQKAMVFGAIWCEKLNLHKIFEDLRDIKRKHNLSSSFELKWNKISPAKVEFYAEVINYFFDNENLHFRALVIPDKKQLDHKSFDQSHDDFYYKMYFTLLQVILKPNSNYNIFLDIKDTKSQNKVEHLKNILHNNKYDFKKEMINKVQQVRAYEVELVQLTDLLIGAISYINRQLNTSQAKLDLINLIQKRSGYLLTKTTLLQEDKFNIFVWEANINKDRGQNA
jgi:hypothetical protein